MSFKTAEKARQVYEEYFGEPSKLYDFVKTLDSNYDLGEREFFLKHYRDGWSYKKLGQVFNMTNVRARQAVTESAHIIEKFLIKNDFDLVYAKYSKDSIPLQDYIQQGLSGTSVAMLRHNDIITLGDLKRFMSSSDLTTLHGFGVVRKEKLLNKLKELNLM